MEIYIKYNGLNKNNLTKGMLMLNSILSAYILQAVHARSLYVNTAISVGRTK